MRYVVYFAGALLIGLSVFNSVASAQTNCANVNNASLSSATTIATTPAYQPFSGTALTHSFSLTVQNANASACSIAIAILRPTAPTAMSNGGFTLNYNLDFNGFSVVNFGTVTSGFFLTAAGGGSGTFNTYNLTIAASQTSAAAGAYADTQVSVELYAYRFGWRFVRSYPLNLTATIDKTCVMSAASPSTLNFTSAIALGVPNSGSVMSSALGGVNCTSPSRVTLSGSAMQRTPAVPSISGFDNFIDWQASATLGSASATLDTSFGSTTTSANYNVGSGTTIGGTVDVDVNLLTGQKLRSGTYSGVLTVTVDPTL